VPERTSDEVPLDEEARTGGQKMNEHQFKDSTFGALVLIVVGGLIYSWIWEASKARWPMIVGAPSGSASGESPDQGRIRLRGKTATLHPAAISEEPRTQTPSQESNIEFGSCGLGSRWEEHEVGLTSTWIRRGASNLFDVTYPRVGITTVDEVTVVGRKVYVKRTFSSDGNLCAYEGELSPDGKSITGTYHSTVGWFNGNSTNWNATINCD
jgi:hypothetical protein